MVQPARNLRASWTPAKLIDRLSRPVLHGIETGRSAAPARRRCAVSDEQGLDPGVDIASLSFDAALAELQRAVAELEQGGLPLERSLALYERGVSLHERCATLLGEADLRVQRLLERSSGTLEVAEARAGEALDQE
jgi:exodeoxyribonuclease VII small subunit